MVAPVLKALTKLTANGRSTEAEEEDDEESVAGPSTRRTRPEKPQLSLSWNGSFAGEDDDPFALLAGGDEGGFLTLEEINEVDYGFIGGVPDPVPGSAVKSKQRKRGKGGADSNGGGGGGGDGSCVVEADEDGNKSEEKADARKKKKKEKESSSRKDRKKKKEKIEEAKENAESAEVDDEELCLELVPFLANEPVIVDVEDDANDNFLLNDDELYAWKELRLHPLLIKSIRRLGFREPTPIQKACIPAAAHQGNDVIGAAREVRGRHSHLVCPFCSAFLKSRKRILDHSKMKKNQLKLLREGLSRLL